ncbi:hypothetical protein ACIQF6_35965 [Kitasatospora sp. NPDC092948]|uniref:hypothetical protein n=1 Tax=Kitasatospora sp. NPDC092948 TaxID=3364088 RepID=UPI00380ED58B
MDHAREFEFLFPGTASSVVRAFEMVRRGSGERVSAIVGGGIPSGRPEEIRAAAAEFNRLAGDVLGRVGASGYDARRFRAREAVRSLTSAMESAAIGDAPGALAATREAWRAAHAAQRRQ